ncbi:MAG TPA: capsular biosynthesis protein CpsA, partial [Sarcina sp.]|nr:capsular biosynthesis protein CpsA [Sarcina sp.]
DAAICNKAYLSLLEDSVPDYSKQAKIIYEKEYETDPDRWERMSALDEDQTGTGESMDETSENASLTDHSFNVLISGIDVDGPITATSRSDVNIIMTVNPMKHRILLTSTPRDYYVHIPYVSGEELDKLTHAGIYGVKTSMKTLENLYGVGISDYIRINFDSLIQLVDVLGGVDVKSEVEFSSGSYHFVKGMNHLNGDQALVFSRVRHAFADGDIQRGKNQM